MNLHSGPETPMDAAVDKREMILAAALGLFVAKGYDGTAVPEIAARAGVGTGTLYRYFPDKIGLVNALYRKWRSALDGLALAPMAPQLGAPEQFALYWRRVLEWYRAHRDPARFLELHAHEPYLDDASWHAARVHGTALRAFIRSGVEAHTLAPIAPELAAALIQGALVGLLRQDEIARRSGRAFLDEAAIRVSAERMWLVIAP
jgi:AcrR family transcriptional regulator